MGEWKKHTVKTFFSDFHIPSKYTDLKAISSGVFGLVCAAFDPSRKTNNPDDNPSSNNQTQNVAIKKIARINTLNQKNVYREIRFLKTVKHNNIVRLYEAFTDATSAANLSDIYLVTELLETNLRNVLNERELNEVQKRLYTYSLCSALKYLHSLGVIHRDLKPENICLNFLYELKLIDFGWSRVEQPQGNATTYVVTRWYRAPELLIRLEKYSTKVDMWSLGCIVAELFTRRPLFQGSKSGPTNLDLDQLREVVQIIDFPDDSLLNGVLEARRIMKKLREKNIEIIGLEARLKYFSPIIEPEALDLIKQLLDWNHETRPSAAEIIKHKYISNYNDNSQEPTASRIDDDLLDANFTIDDWKVLLFDEMDYHRENQ